MVAHRGVRDEECDDTVDVTDHHPQGTSVFSGLFDAVRLTWIIVQTYPDENKRPADLQRSLDYYEATKGRDLYPKAGWSKGDEPPKKRARNQ